MKMELTQIVEMVQKEFRSRTEIGTRRVAIDGDNDQIVLSGSVGSYYQKQLVQEAVKRVLNNWPAIGVRNDVSVEYQR